MIYGNQGWGDIDQKRCHPRDEIIPATQTSDISDAIIYAQSRPEVNTDKIGIWGSLYRGGHVLW